MDCRVFITKLWSQPQMVLMNNGDSEYKIIDYECDIEALDLMILRVVRCKVERTSTSNPGFSDKRDVIQQ